MRIHLLFICLLGIAISANSIFLGQYYDSFTQTTVHVCNGPEPNAVYIGISLADNPYFIYGFGRGLYTALNTASGSEMYLLQNSALTVGSFVFNAVNSTRWVGSFTPAGTTVGTVVSFTLDQVDTESPEQEYCIRPSPLNNITVFGLWEWLETKNALYHHTQATFFTINGALSPSPVVNSSFYVANSTVGGCWGYTDFTTNEEFKGGYTGIAIYENRGWIGYARRSGDPDAFANFFMRIGNSAIEDRLVGYYLLPGRTNPAGFQIISNSVTIGNPAQPCPIEPRSNCPSSTGSAHRQNGVMSSLLTSF